MCGCCADVWVWLSVCPAPCLFLSRCVHLVATGVQQLVGMEFRHIPALAVLMPAGVKLLLVNPAVRRGMLLLQKENVVVLGGVVSDGQASSTAHASMHCALWQSLPPPYLSSAPS